MVFADPRPQLKAVLPHSLGMTRRDGVDSAPDPLPGGLLVDTSWVPPEDRFAFWQSASSEVIGPVRVESRAQHPFSAQLFAYPLGPLTVGRVTSDTASLQCAAKTVATAEFLLVLMESGHLKVDMCGTEVGLGPGDLLLCDWSLPCEIASVGDESFKTLTMNIPRSLVHSHQNELRQCVGRRVPAGVAAGRLISAFLREMGDVLANGSLVADDFRLAECAIDLTLALFLEGDRADPASVRMSRATLLRQVKTYIEAHLGDPDLDPESIAQAHFISVRLLYKLFEGGGPSVAEWIRQRRLECCRRDLADRSLADIPVTKIAARWGFTNAAHFSRTFRTAVGCSPREFRNRMLYQNEMFYRNQRLSRVQLVGAGED